MIPDGKPRVPDCDVAKERELGDNSLRLTELDRQLFGMLPTWESKRSAGNSCRLSPSRYMLQFT